MTFILKRTDFFYSMRTCTTTQMYLIIFLFFSLNAGLFSICQPDNSKILFISPAAKQLGIKSHLNIEHSYNNVNIHNQKKKTILLNSALLR